jgi:hypothetical protein
MHTGQQTHQCKACGRPFVLHAEERRILVARPRRETILLRGVRRAVGVGITWLMHCMVGRLKAAPDRLPIQLPRSPGRGHRATV